MEVGPVFDMAWRTLNFASLRERGRMAFVAFVVATYKYTATPVDRVHQCPLITISGGVIRQF